MVFRTEESAESRHPIPDQSRLWGSQRFTYSGTRYGEFHVAHRFRARDWQSDRQPGPTCKWSKGPRFVRIADMMRTTHATLAMLGLLVCLAPAHWQSASHAQPIRTADEIDPSPWNPAPGGEAIAKVPICPLQNEGEGEGEGEPESADYGRGVGSSRRSATRR